MLIIRRSLTVAAVAILLGMAGCLSDALEPSDGEAGAPGGESKPGARPHHQPAREFPESSGFHPNLHLSDCTGLEFTVRLLDALMRDPSPSPWSGDNGEMFWLEIYLFECQRVGWGDIERGPIKFILETESINGHPRACVKQGSPQPGFIHAVYTDEPEFGFRFAEAMFTTFHPAAIDVDKGSLESTRLGTASWRIPDGEASKLEFLPASAPPFTGSQEHIFLAPGDNKTVRLTLETQETTINVFENVGKATFAEPTLFAAEYLPIFNFDYADNLELEATGIFEHWENTTCDSSRSSS